MFRLIHLDNRLYTDALPVVSVQIRPENAMLMHEIIYMHQTFTGMLNLPDGKDGVEYLIRTRSQIREIFDVATRDRKVINHAA